MRSNWLMFAILLTLLGILMIMASSWQLYKSGEIISKIQLMLASVVHVIHRVSLCMIAIWAQRNSYSSSIKYIGIFFTTGIILYSFTHYLSPLVRLSSGDLFTISMFGGALLCCGWIAWLIKVLDSAKQ